MECHSSSSKWTALQRFGQQQSSSPSKTASFLTKNPFSANQDLAKGLQLLARKARVGQSFAWILAMWYDLLAYSTEHPVSHLNLESFFILCKTGSEREKQRKNFTFSPQTNHNKRIANIRPMRIYKRLSHSKKRPTDEASKIRLGVDKKEIFEFETLALTQLFLPASEKRKRMRVF